MTNALLEEDRAEVGKLTLRCNRHNSDLGHAAGRFLESVDLNPGLPSGALLVVRRLSLVRTAVDDRAPWATPAARREELELRERIAHLWRNAARPALGPVPASAEAVLFADELEVLACLALDEAGGRTGTRWWWDRLASRLGISRGLGYVLAQQAHLVPALVAALEESGAVAVARRLGTVECRKLLGRLLAAHGLQDLVPEPLRNPQVEQVVTSVSAGPARRAPDASPGTWYFDDDLTNGFPSLAPWEALLVMVARTIALRPSTVRSTVFKTAVRAWMELHLEAPVLLSPGKAAVEWAGIGPAERGDRSGPGLTGLETAPSMAPGDGSDRG